MHLLHAYLQDCTKFMPMYAPCADRWGRVCERLVCGGDGRWTGRGKREWEENGVRGEMGEGQTTGASGRGRNGTVRVGEEHSPDGAEDRRAYKLRKRY